MMLKIHINTRIYTLKISMTMHIKLIELLLKLCCVMVVEMVSQLTVV